jgi:tRNA-guanine family transglycosylase
MNNAAVAREWERKHRSGVMYVIQGWDLKSYLQPADYLSELGGSRFGLGSLKASGPSRTLEILRVVRTSIGESPSLHLFGVCDPPKLRQYAPYVDSIDLSLPIKASVNKVIFDPKSMVRLSIRSVHSVHPCPCPICAKSGSKVYMQGLKGDARTINVLRAVHNAYLLTQLAHTLNCSNADEGHRN